MNMSVDHVAGICEVPREFEGSEAVYVVHSNDERKHKEICKSPSSTRTCSAWECAAGEAAEGLDPMQVRPCLSAIGYAAFRDCFFSCAAQDGVLVRT